MVRFVSFVTYNDVAVRVNPDQVESLATTREGITRITCAKSAYDVKMSIEDVAAKLERPPVA